MLANISGSKVGAKGRPLPGSTEIRLGGYDAATGRFIEDDNGFVRACANDEVGVLLAKALSGPDAARGAMRSVFAEGDTWVTTDHLFRRDYDGDYWFVDNRSTVIQSALGPVFCQPICDALGEVMVIDMAVVYPVATDTHDVAVAALMLDNDGVLTSAALTAALGRLPGTSGPRSSRSLTTYRSRRPTARYRPLQSAGLPAAGKRLGITTVPTAIIGN